MYDEMKVERILRICNLQLDVARLVPSRDGVAHISSGRAYVALAGCVVHITDFTVNARGGRGLLARQIR